MSVKMHQWRVIRQFKGETYSSGALISVRCMAGFQINERVEILDTEDNHIAFATVTRDLSKDPKFQEVVPFNDPRSRRKLKPYNSAEFMWELRIE